MRRFRSTLVLFLGMGPLTVSGAQGPTSEAVAQASESFRAGIDAVQRNDLQAAATAFERVVRLTPQVGLGHSALGAVLLQQNKTQAAIAELETALRIDEKDAPGRLNLGLAYTALAATSRESLARTKAIEAFRAWQAQTGAALPSDAAVADATMLSAEGDRSAAVQVLDASLAAEPANSVLLDAAGVLLAQEERFTEARTRFEQALSSAMTSSPQLQSTLHMHLGATLLASGEGNAAEVQLRQATETDPANVQARVQLGKAQFTLGHEEEALATLRKAQAQASRDYSANYELALALESAGQTKASLPFFEAARAIAPPSAALLTNMGLALVQDGRAKEAVPLYLQALKFDEKNATLHQDLGVAYLQQSDLDSAIHEFRRGLELDAASGQIAYDLGLALKLKDDLPNAIVAFEKAKSLDPTLADAPYTLGVLYMQQGRFEDAAASLRAALSLRPENADAWSMLGSVLKQNGQPADAAKALRKAIALDPGQPGNHVNLAAVLVELGKKDEAVAERKVAADLARAANTRQRASFALDSGNVLRQRGQFAEAITQYRNAIASDPNNAVAHTALADVLDQTGAKAEAAQERLRAVALASAKK